MRTYYLYRHIRLDTNQPFYIGIGVVRPSDELDKAKTRYYRRAYSKQYRNNYWNNVVNKVGYEVEIMYECNSEDEINNKEIEFIRFYGRKDLGLGNLVNMSDGGEQHLNCSQETKDKISKSTAGVKKSPYKWTRTPERVKQCTINVRKARHLTIPIEVYLGDTLFKEFNSMKECAVYFGVHSSTVYDCAQGEMKIKSLYSIKRKN